MNLNDYVGHAKLSIELPFTLSNGIKTTEIEVGQLLSIDDKGACTFSAWMGGEKGFEIIHFNISEILNDPTKYAVKHYYE